VLLPGKRNQGFGQPNTTFVLYRLPKFKKYILFNSTYCLRNDIPSKLSLKRQPYPHTFDSSTMQFATLTVLSRAI